MARTFDDILAQVTAQSDPQRQTVLNQIADLPNQQAAQTAALGAQKDQAYTDILSGARQRGLGFSGIPLAEQAKYNATTYAPAVANLATSFNNQKSSLESALAGIGSNDYTAANNIYGQEQQLALQQQQQAEARRQFDANLAFQKQQAAAQSTSNSALANLLAGGLTPQQAQAPTGPTQQQQADYNFVRNLINQVNGGDGRTWSLIFAQAKAGNQRSKDILNAFYQLQNKAAPATIARYL